MKPGQYSGIARLSPKTNGMDCHKLVKDYLLRVGHNGRRPIGALHVWVNRVKGRVVKVGPTPESVKIEYKE